MKRLLWNKDMLEPIIVRLWIGLRNNFLKHWCEANKKAYNAQRNLYVSLVREANKEYFDNLDHKKVTDNKTFWKTISPFLQIRE